MVTIKSPREMDVMAEAGRILAGTLAHMRDIVRPGMTTEDLDRAAEEFIRSHPGATPSFKGLYGFPKTLCTSINQEIVHGIPSPKRVLKEGSVVSVDCGVQYEGLHVDSAVTLPVGEISPKRSVCSTSPRSRSRRESRRPDWAITSATSAMRCSRWPKGQGTASSASWSGTASARGSMKSRRFPTTVLPSAAPGSSQA